MSTSNITAFGSRKSSLQILHDTKPDRRPTDSRLRTDSPMSPKHDLSKTASHNDLPNVRNSYHSSASSSTSVIAPSFSEDETHSSSDASPIPTSEDTSPTSSEDRKEDDVPSQRLDSHVPTVKEDTLSPAALKTDSLARRLSRRLTSRTSRSLSPSKYDDTTAQADDLASPAAPSVLPSPHVGSKQPSLLMKRSSGQVPLSQCDPNDMVPATSISTPTRNTIPRRKSFIASNFPFDERLKLSNRASMLAKSFSVDRLSHLNDSKRHVAVGGPVPTINIADYTASLSSLALTNKRDELWNNFRVLDSDFVKFNAKSTAQKPNVVRQSLLPFLRDYQDHSSNSGLRAEDLTRRTVILNKWWIGLLELLHGKNNQSLSGIDRPAILDALSGIMDRPEWRCSFVDEQESSRLRRGQSSSSLAQSNDRFEPVPTNTRNLFVQNLTAQMAFVVERMSLRNASASLVLFCGKATAYAFFFCPTVADTLVRAWSLSATTLRRVLNEHGVGKFDRLENTAHAFPPALHNLQFSSLSECLKYLHAPAQTPVANDRLKWYGHWLPRWRGRESDFFYVFAKNYFILAAEFMTSDANAKDIVRVPAMLLVQGQLLSALDSTVHRAGSGGGPQGYEAPSAAISTHDDIIAEREIASTLSILPVNAHRIMAENRLVMLIRDVLSDNLSDSALARQIFAVSFNRLLHASARQVSVFDHAACRTLCDLLEEVLQILVRYEHLISARGTIIDTAFWFSVFRRMLDSQNTMTEIRLLIFLYAVWNTLCPDDDKRKLELCQQVVLDDQVFTSTFTHWCPMVRAYYMRLLCWRVGRVDNDSTESSQKVAELLLSRLHTAWSWYSYMQTREDIDQGTLALSTAPLDPAPGRRMVIVRTDPQSIRGGALVEFDGMLLPTTTRPYQVNASSSAPLIEPDMLSLASSDGEGDTQDDGSRDAGLKGFIRGIMGQTKKGSGSESRSPFASPPNGFVMRRSEGASDGTARPVVEERQQQQICFKFSLEPVHRLMPVAAHPERRLSCPRLPLPAQRALQKRFGGPLEAPTACAPPDQRAAHVRYLGRAIAEWTVIVGECQGFFERRKSDGIMENKYVETPSLGLEVCRR